MTGYVYILASQKLGTLYIGVTSDIGRRIWEHRDGLVDGFTKQYDVKMLVYYELFDRIDDAIFRDKQLKKWNRQWKINLIEASNPDWNDLSSTLL
ncbi:GIY-YIG nuclease family protein [Niveispirillum irakense]|uniref:GIY-YIG nuclease family protein n=1 Tax=Niveispirillum irakense TaxID=34011 RepID=UPI0004075F65|nr:GIY-YIG nuclease family protein [Niveispirillum irakense]